MSRRTARKINELLATHVPLEAVAYLWAEGVHRVERRMAKLIDAAGERVPSLAEPPGRAVLIDEVGMALAELGDAERYGPVPDVMPPDERRAEAKRSRSLPEARAQAAQLQVRLMDLKARIVHLPPGA